MDNKSIKENIRNCRKKFNLTQRDMAEKLGVSRTTYRNLETGKTVLLNGKVDKIAEILDICVDEIVLGYNPYSPSGVLADSRLTYGEFVDVLKKNHVEEVNRLTAEIEKLKKENTSLNEFNQTLQSLIETKDEIISMLKRVGQKKDND